MTGNEIRQKFLDYFEQRGHKIVNSSPVFPPNDPTILFTNAGMNQFKDVFLGNEKRDYNRAVSSQKCIRAGGKHNDLDEVGKTARHHTFFEMLGNFSFGDYFKEDAIKFAWDFLTGSIEEGKLGLNPNYLWFTYFEGNENVPADTEARDLWIKVGAKPEQVLPFDAKDNFWQMGDTGPCGPCSEIHYYMGDEPDNPEKNRPEFVNAETGDETIEIWNLVFMQFNRIGIGEQFVNEKNQFVYQSYELKNLPAPSVDTGAGLERIAAVMQGKSNNYDTDLLLPIIKNCIANLADKHYEYDTPEGFAMRVVADHARAAAFAIADGISPGNVGRNYVLRKIISRAILYGRENLNFDDLFFYKVTNFVIDLMHEAYPELEKSRAAIDLVVRQEEENFSRKLLFGLKNLEKELDESINPFSKGFQILVEEGYNKMEEYLEEHNQKYGDNKGTISLIKLSYKYKIPPFLTKIFLESHEDLADHFWTTDWTFGINFYDHIMMEGNEEEKKLLAGLENRADEVLSRLNIHFFKPFADVYNTFGYPKDLIRVGLEKRGIEIPEELFNETFDAALQELQQQSSVGQTQRKSVISPMYHKIAEKVGANKFHGYEKTQVEDAKVVALVKDDQQIEELKEGEEGLIVLDETPFYAEAGGQVGDVGTLVRTAYGSGRVSVENPSTQSANKTPSATADGSDKGANIKVFDTFAPVAGIVLHKSKIERGSIKVGDEVTATVDVEKRDATRRNHTATHLVHAALKEVLGTHVKQAGSVVAPNYLRFDFTHYQSLTTEEVKEVEDLVNRYILQNEPVETDVMAIEEAMSSGAVALFGEKYGSNVRVLRVGEGVFSKELCGGTHVRATGDIGSFKITADESIASGVRRIRAVTGIDAFERSHDNEILIDKSLGFLKTQRDQLPNAIEKMQEELKKARLEIADLKVKIATGTINKSNDETRDVKGVKVISKSVIGLNSNEMRQLSDTLLRNIKSGIVVLGGRNDMKVSLTVRISDDLTNRIQASQIMKEVAPLVGGRGGGKADMAEGGGNQLDKLDEAVEASYSVIEKMLA